MQSERADLQVCRIVVKMGYNGRDESLDWTLEVRGLESPSSVTISEEKGQECWLQEYKRGVVGKEAEEGKGE